MADDRLTQQEEVVKRYLDEQSEKDDALRALYVPRRIKDCFKFIMSEARKMAVDGCAVIEDAVVFKWARDYYLEELPKKARREDAVAVAEKHGISAKTEKKTVMADENTVFEKDGVRYDSRGCGLLFDFS